MMQQAILIEDVWSCFNIRQKDRLPYGKKGESLKIISEHGNVMIVEKSNGNRYAVNQKLLMIKS